jgi:multidrug efflux pump subunit AcrA (membrane-fusion protein)
MTPRLIAFVSVTAPAPQSDQGLGQTIRDAVEEAKREAQQEMRNAQQEARAAQQQVRDAQQRVRDAQQEIRDAQQQMRDARTNDQRGAANQAIAGAQQALREAEAELRQLQRETRTGPFVYTGQPASDSRPMIPGEAVDIAIGFFITCAVIIVGWPISRALGRRFERRGAVPAVESGMTEQLQRIEQSVEAIAIEVERISESQRFLAKLQEKSASALE